jgi:hypothetical protein
MEKKCKYCAMMIPKGAKICPHCRKKLKWGWLAKIFLGFMLLAAVLAIIGTITEEKKKSSESPQKDSLKRVIDKDPEGKSGLKGTDRKYYSKAYEFLYNNKDATEKLLNTCLSMQNQPPETGLSLIKEEIKRADRIYSVTWKDYEKTPVPPIFKELDNSIKKLGNLNRQATKELLLFWDDQDISHIPRGMDLYKKVLLQNTECSKEFIRLGEKGLSEE